MPLTKNLQDIYDSSVRERESYLYPADALARLTLPELNPLSNNRYYSSSGLNNAYYHNLAQPYSSAGTQAVTGLASAMLAILFPINIPWFELLVDDDEIEREAEESAQVDAALATLERRIIEDMTSDHYHALVLEGLYRVLIEGNVIIQVLPDDGGLRYIPLRNFTCRRYNGALSWVCLKEEVKNESDPTRPKCLYTYVDYDASEVYQQVEGEQSPRKVDLDPADFILVTTKIPTTESYATGYALRYYGAIYQINQMAFDMTRATSIAAKSFLFISPESGLTPQELANLQPGQAIVGDANAVQWLKIDSKLNEFSWVYQALEVEKKELFKNFALGLSQNPELNKSHQTAESVRRLSQELDSSVGAIAQVLQSTLQKPLAEAYLRRELEDTPELASKLKPMVTSGSSAMSRVSELQNLFNLLNIFMADPRFAARVDPVAIFRHAAKIIGVPVEQFIIEQGPGAMLPQQAMTPEQMQQQNMMTQPPEPQPPTV